MSDHRRELQEQMWGWAKPIRRYEHELGLQGYPASLDRPAPNRELTYLFEAFNRARMEVLSHALPRLIVSADGQIVEYSYDATTIQQLAEIDLMWSQAVDIAIGKVDFAVLVQEMIQYGWAYRNRRQL